MSDTVIKVENLSKRYVIGHQRQERYVTLRDAIANSANSLKQRFFHPNQKLEDPAHEEFWALKDVSFEIKQGDCVGIIGRNGAGKSTLLKILSRITEPTSGKVSIRGRVASLLEVGTGFHAELTGRENIFLNGAILGMSRVEIKKKFDEIVDFAEVERFLDTPVKHYSSGMYVRLAFAVAAHLEPEILIVDEVLAVGDAAFQKKCLGKMEDVAEKEGRTVLFVSHNMAAVKNLCTRVFLLYQGIFQYNGKTLEGIEKYLLSNTINFQHFKGDSILKSFNIINNKKEAVTTIQTNDSVELIAHIEVNQKLFNPSFGYGIVNMFGERITTLHTYFQFQKSWQIESKVLITVLWKNCKVCPGEYKIMAALYDGNQKIKVWDEITTISIESTDYYKTGKMPETGNQGWLLSDAEWTIDSIQSD